jgi:hypothetical protein
MSRWTGYLGAWPRHLRGHAEPSGRHQEAAVRIGAVLVILWIIVGFVAAGQRGYLGGSGSNCAKFGSTVTTVIAGPLNYMGVNPKIKCDIPEPSK